MDVEMDKIRVLHNPINPFEVDGLRIALLAQGLRKKSFHL
jgi:hypothetical protein